MKNKTSHKKKRSSKKNRLVKRGTGILNKLIDKLPVELHIPGYQYCGPGTKLEKRLARGDKGINDLDAACKLHDIAYENKDSKARNLADKELQKRAMKRVFAKDAKLLERVAALGQCFYL